MPGGKSGHSTCSHSACGHSTCVVIQPVWSFTCGRETTLVSFRFKFDTLSFIAYAFALVVVRVSSALWFTRSLVTWRRSHPTETSVPLFDTSMSTSGSFGSERRGNSIRKRERWAHRPRNTPGIQCPQAAVSPYNHVDVVNHILNFRALLST